MIAAGMIDQMGETGGGLEDVGEEAVLSLGDRDVLIESGRHRRQLVAEVRTPLVGRVGGAGQRSLDLVDRRAQAGPTLPGLIQ